MPLKPAPLPASGSYATPSELAHGDESEAGADPVGVATGVVDEIGDGVEPEWPQAANANDATTSPIPNSLGRVRKSRANLSP